MYLNDPLFDIVNAVGAPISGAKAYFYNTGTDDLVNTYTTVQRTVANTNPVIADSAGRFPAIYLDPDITYRLKVFDANDVLLVDRDPIAVAGDGDGDETLVLSNIAALQAYNAPTVEIPELVSLINNYTAGDGGGVFRYDSTDTTTADNGGTVIVDASSRRWKRQYLEPANLRWWNAVGNGTTNNASAISQTEGLNELVNIPTGIYKTASLATGAAVRGRYDGPGQIRTADDNNRAPIFRAITQAPGAFGSTVSVESAFNGDVSRVVFPVEYRITGAATAGQPTTGYLYRPELSEKFSFLYNESGHNQSTSTNVGRTGIVNSRVNIYHRGQGDLVAYNFSAFCDSTRASSTHFLANPAIVGINGDMTAGANGIYFNPLEFYLDSSTYDVAAVGAVYNLERNNNTGAKSAFWTGVRVQSVGSTSINAGYSGVGSWVAGLSLAGVTFTAAKAAIVLAEGQRIYFEGSNSDPNGGDNGIVTGDTWLERSGSGFFSFVYDNTSTLQINTYWTNSAFRINTAEHYEIDGVTVIDGDKGIRFPSYTATDIAAVGNAVNTANKAAGKAVWDTTNNRLMVASGSSAASPWYVCDGSASVTPS